MLTGVAQGVGIQRRLQDAGVLTNLNKVIVLNSEEKGHLIDEVLPKCKGLIPKLTDAAVFGQICSNEPGLTPGFIRSGLLTDLLKSIEARLPNSIESLDSLSYALSSFVIH